MADMTRMQEVICDEIDKIADKGLTSSNIEAAYKLIDMYKDLKTVEAMETGGYSNATYYEDGVIPMDGGGVYRGSERGDSMRGRRRDAMGRYSNANMVGRSYADEKYSEAKRNYRQSRAGKNDVMDSLNEKMRELRDELKSMSKDSDFPEERRKIDKYVDMMDGLIQ